MLIFLIHYYLLRHHHSYTRHLQQFLLNCTNYFIQIIFIYKDILHLFWLFYQIFNLFSTNLYMIDTLYIYGNLFQVSILFIYIITKTLTAVLNNQQSIIMACFILAPHHLVLTLMDWFSYNVSCYGVFYQLIYFSTYGNDI